LRKCSVVTVHGLAPRLEKANVNSTREVGDESATPVALEHDPERVVFDTHRGLLFETEESLVPGWIDHIDLWIDSANTRVALDEAAEEKRRAEAQNREDQDLLLSRINEKFKDL